MKIYALLLLAGVGLASASCPSDLAEKYIVDGLIIKWCQACNQILVDGGKKNLTPQCRTLVGISTKPALN